MGVNSLPKTVTRQRRGCDLNPSPFVPESSTLTTRLPSHPLIKLLPYISFEKYINILALEMVSPGNRHCANCIGTLSFSLWTIDAECDLFRHQQ